MDSLASLPRVTTAEDAINLSVPTAELIHQAEAGSISGAPLDIVLDTVIAPGVRHVSTLCPGYVRSG